MRTYETRLHNLNNLLLSETAGPGSVLPPWGDDDAENPDCLQVCMAVDTGLPPWAYPREVADLVLQHGNDRRCTHGVPPLACTSGPAVKLGFAALGNLWIFFCVAPFIAFWTASCPDGEGFAECDDLLLFLLVGIVMLVGAWLQNQVMGHVIISQLGVTRDFSLFEFPFNRYPYPVFVSFTTLLMCAGYLDIMTNAETLGKILRTRQCKSYNAISSTWNITMAESIFQVVPGFDGADIDHIALVAYCLMLAQPIFALVYSVPLDADVDYEVGFGENYKFEYRTLYDASGTNHGAVLQVLAEATRFEAVNFQDFKYAAEKMDWWEGRRLEGWEYRCLHLAQVEVDRGVARFFLVGLLQNSVQINLQISIMALSREVSGELDGQLLFSVIMSMLISFGDFSDAYDKLSLSWRARYLLMTEALDHISDAEYSEEIEGLIRNLWWMIARFCIYIFFYSIMLGYAWLKLVGFFYCNHHLFNLTGCVAV